MKAILTLHILHINTLQASNKIALWVAETKKKKTHAINGISENLRQRCLPKNVGSSQHSGKSVAKEVVSP